MMTVNEIIQKVDSLNIKSNYWFVRTENGTLFDEFYKNNYIAIGWDYLSLYEIKYSNEESIKKKIASNEKFDVNTKEGKTKISITYNKLRTFNALIKDDIVVIPSRNSDRLAFGRIIDDTTYEEFKAKKFTKRRKVKWIEIKSMEDLNPIFFQVKSNQHAISNIKNFAPHIDRVMGNLYSKGNNTHYVLNIEKRDDVNFDELSNLMTNIKSLMQKINNEFEINDDKDEFYIKINLQSKGALELIKSGKSLAILAYLIFITSCNNNENASENDTEIKQFYIENKSLLDSTSRVLDLLQINTNELTKPFNKNGN